MNKRRKGNWEWIIDQFDPDYLLVQKASPLPNKMFATIRSTTKNRHEKQGQNFKFNYNE